LIRWLKDEAGYSLVEVMASIVILTIAIIPMVGMFDMGLNMASRSGNYDKARAFANERLENAKSLPYGAVNSNSFPGGTPSSCGGGCRRYENPVPSSAGLPAGSTYRLEKQYLGPPDPALASQNFQSSGVPTNWLRITVTVNWSDDSYTTSGVVAR